MAGEIQTAFGKRRIWNWYTYAVSGENCQGILSYMKGSVVRQREPRKRLAAQFVHCDGGKMYFISDGILLLQGTGCLAKPCLICIGMGSQHQHVIQIRYAGNGVSIKDTAVKITSNKP